MYCTLMVGDKDASDYMDKDLLTLTFQLFSY